MDEDEAPITNANLPLPVELLLAGESTEGYDITLDPDAPDYQRWHPADIRWEILEAVEEHQKVMRPATAGDLEHPLDYLLGIFLEGEDVESFTLELARKELARLREDSAVLAEIRHTGVIVDHADLDKLMEKANNWDDMGIPPGLVMTSYNIWLKPKYDERPKINVCGKVER
jgi:hypothetical protein